MYDDGVIRLTEAELFKQTLRRQGLYLQYTNAKREIRRLYPHLPEVEIEDMTLRNFGYRGDGSHVVAAVRNRIGTDAEIRREYKRERKEKAMAGDKDQKFQEVLLGLAATADRKAELDWIRQHPAMMKKSRMVNPNQPVVLEPDEIKDAPSRAAAQELSHWANNPNEFFKMFLSESRKAGAIGTGAVGGAGSTETVEDDTGDIARMLDMGGR